MEKRTYEKLRELSNLAFKNALILPVSYAVLSTTESGGFVEASEVREFLDGRLESNQIRKMFERIEAFDALRELPYGGRPYARTWERVTGPYWIFVDDWVHSRI
jgi:hypothetical protein